MSERFIIRVFDGTRSAHVGPVGDLLAAEARARRIASRARRRGLNVSVTVRPLHAGRTAVDEVLDALAPGSRFHVGSYAGVPDHGDLGEQDALNEGHSRCVDSDQDVSRATAGRMLRRPSTRSQLGLSS